MEAASFAAGLRELVSKSPLFARDELSALVVINPKAGGFSRPAKAAAVSRDLAQALSRAEAMPAREAPLSWETRLTEGPKHAARIAADCLEAAAMKPGLARLVVLACGDGTSLEFLDELSRAPDEIRNLFTVLRLPLGTGNDGSDGRELSDSLSRLLGEGEPALQPALRVVPAPGGPASMRAPGGEWRAFNIASLGLDAYVTDMTNRLKSRLPGDSYKLWLDVASILYDRVYPPRDMAILGFDAEGRPTATLEGRFLLTAMGVSGRRTYGSNKRILPDDDNVCAVRQMPFGRKIALKARIDSGKIRDFGEVELFSAAYLEFRYGDRILVQMDGEAELLTPADFPLRIEKTAPSIRHLARLVG